MTPPPHSPRAIRPDPTDLRGAAATGRASAVSQVPTGTYRLQLQPGFGFAEAQAAVPYLASLGVSHLHLSPVLEAVPGSTHGYDVVDHSRVRGELGGEGGLRALSAAAGAAGLGLVVDVVPNHMAWPTPEHLNNPWWQVLLHGRESRFGSWFDVDWAARDGRLLLPVLAGPAEQVADDLRVLPGGGVQGENVLGYFEHRFPLRAGTAALPLPRLLDAQHYELADWRLGDRQLNYRRFFTVSTLMGLRQEDPDVFAATHELVLRLVREGVLHGLRIDHPDGLADPAGYLRRLRAEAGPDTWIVVEKILTGDEELPGDWECAGTTGYDALRRVDGVFTDPAGSASLHGLHRELTGAQGPFTAVTAAARAEVVDGGLAAETARLERTLDRAGMVAADRGEALRALLCALDAYRAYPVPGRPPTAVSMALFSRALTAVPGPLAVTARRLADLALGRGTTVAEGEFAVRFAQTAAATAAKAVEDRAFYRWYVLSSCNEVGGSPDVVGCPVEEFHTFARRLAATWPAGMTTLSTHDTKRSEDVRARIGVLSECPGDWATLVRTWAREWGQGHAGEPGPPNGADPFDSYLLWQTLVGAWPISEQRAVDHLRKAMREAERSTSWTAPDERYETAALHWVRRVLADPRCRRQVADAVARLDPHARVASLGAKLVQLAMPGVPDVYQGGEGVLRTLVDPDNRAVVDLASAARLLRWLDGGRVGASPAGRSGQVDPLAVDKLLVTSRVLRVRRRHPLWFGPDAPYRALPARGSAAAHVLAFTRTHAIAVATRLAVSLAAAGGFGDTVLPLPPGRWRDVLSGRGDLSGELPVGSLLRLQPPGLPVALLVPQ